LSHGEPAIAARRGAVKSSLLMPCSKISTDCRFGARPDNHPDALFGFSAGELKPAFNPVQPRPDLVKLCLEVSRYFSIVQLITAHT
jgi:hypothetical protein